LQQGAAGETGPPATFAPPRLDDLAQLFPQLEILNFIGRGGMGAVYKARQKELDRVVALKILPPGIGDRPGFAERFTREAKALAKLNHPGIVTIHDTGRVDGLYYLLMEFVDGVDLRQLLQAGRIEPREALAIVLQICDALQYAHEAGIVHRDIKPENILLDRQGRVKVADFVLAKLMSTPEPTVPGTAAPPAPATTEAGQLMGTPQYMAPEQVAHPPTVDHRADIYSLGVVFYQMLTGELPGRQLEPPSRKVEIDVRLDEVVLRALEQQPDRRYQQVRDVKTMVETILTTPPAPKGETTMDIHFVCPQCHQPLGVDPASAGATVYCPSCGSTLTVPAPGTPPPPPPPPATPPKRARGLAITSLVLGIIGLVPILGMATGVIGLALGITALVKRTTSKGVAVAGTVIAGIATLMIPLHIAMLMPVITTAKFGANTAVCMTNLKTIGVGIAGYQQKHNGAYPANLDVLVKEGLLSSKTLQCPLHAGAKGVSSYEYARPAGTSAEGILAWDRIPHRAFGKKIAGRNVLNADLSVRYVNEEFFQQALATAIPRPPPPRPARPTPTPTTSSTPPPVAVPAMTVASAVAALKTAPVQEQGRPLQFLAKAPVEPAQRDAVIAAVKPLLNDVEHGALAFQVFANWATTEQVPDFIEFIRIDPKSARGKESMKILSRMGDARAAAPLAACLTEFGVGRDAKAAIAALGPVAKPAILPYYHHENRGARDAGRELLRGYQATDEEIRAESFTALKSESIETRKSAIEYFATATLPADQRGLAARALYPLVTDTDRWVRDAARKALQKLVTKADADFLLEQVQSTDDATRQFATDLLVEFKDARVAKPLAALLAANIDTWRTSTALTALGSLAEPAVIPHLQSEDWGAQCRAAEILGKIGTAKSLPALQALTKGPNFHVKVAAERAIAAIKARPPEANR
jgi:serine/threonine protein kinase